MPCSLAEAKAEAKAEVGPAPEEGKPVPHVDAKSEEKPAEAKAGDKRLKLSPEEKDRVKIPGFQSWRMRLRSDPGLSPLLKYLNNDASLDPQADLVELGRQSTRIAVEDGLLVRRTKGKANQLALELVVPNISRIDLLTEAHNQHTAASNTPSAR